MQYISYILYLVVIATLITTVFYSYRSRRAKEFRLKGLYAARMNISIGFMMTAIAVIQLFLFVDSMVRVIVGTVFLLVGLFNLFAGIRNHSYFSAMK